jgi:integrase/recombinase XerD
VAAPKRPTRPTVAHAVAKYAESLHRRVAAGRFSPGSLSAYIADLEDFVLLAGAETVLDDLEPEDLEDILAMFSRLPDRRRNSNQASGTRSLGSQARFAKTVSTLFTYADMQSWLQLNPWPQVGAKPRPAKVTAAGRAGLPVAAATALLESPSHTPGRKPHYTQLKLEHRDHFILRLLMETGPRVSELTKADRADLQNRDGSYWLNIRFGKGGKMRAIPLSGPTVNEYLLYEQVERATPSGKNPEQLRNSETALLLTHRGLRMSPRDIQRLVRAHVTRTDPRHALSVVPHGLRHTAATLLLASGAASVAEVRDILGHESLATTGIYTDSFSEGILRAVESGPLAHIELAGAPDTAR